VRLLRHSNLDYRRSRHRSRVFLEKHRSDLPKAPACNACNAEKSRLEHYLTAVLPFGGRHFDAITNLETMVPKRLQKNAKLHAELRGRLAEIQDRANLQGFATTLPIDYVRLAQLFALIAKGLAWFHWQIILKQGYSAVAAFFLDRGAQFFGRLFSESKTLNHTSGDLGHGTFSYEGIQFAHDPNETLWRLSIYGGACFGNPSSPGEKASQIIAVTAAYSQLQDFQDLFSRKQKN